MATPNPSSGAAVRGNTSAAQRWITIVAVALVLILAAIFFLLNWRDAFGGVCGLALGSAISLGISWLLRIVTKSKIVAGMLAAAISYILALSALIFAVWSLTQTGVSLLSPWPWWGFGTAASLALIFIWRVARDIADFGSSKAASNPTMAGSAGSRGATAPAANSMIAGQQGNNFRQPNRASYYGVAIIAFGIMLYLIIGFFLTPRLVDVESCRSGDQNLPAPALSVEGQQSNTITVTLPLSGSWLYTDTTSGALAVACFNIATTQGAFSGYYTMYFPTGKPASRFNFDGKFNAQQVSFTLNDGELAGQYIATFDPNQGTLVGAYRNRSGGRGTWQAQRQP